MYGVDSGGQASQIAGKTKQVESVTGLFKGITGKQDVKNVLSGVAVSSYTSFIFTSNVFQCNKLYLTIN